MSTKAEKKLDPAFLRQQKKPNSRTVWIIGDAEMAQELQAARDKLLNTEIRLQAQTPDSRLREELSQAVVDLKARVDHLEADVKAASTKFNFRALGRKTYSDLITAYAPTEVQLAAAKAAEEEPPQFNSDTFPPALIGYSMLEPLKNSAPYPAPLDQDIVDYVDWIFNSDDWNEVEIMELFFACVGVNNTRSNVSLGKD